MTVAQLHNDKTTCSLVCCIYFISYHTCHTLAFVSFSVLLVKCEFGCFWKLKVLRVCVFFFLDLVHYSQDSQVQENTNLTLKLDLTILFTHLKIILLQYFQFSTISSIQTDFKISFQVLPVYIKHLDWKLINWEIIFTKFILCYKVKG